MIQLACGCVISDTGEQNAGACRVGHRPSGAPARPTPPPRAQVPKPAKGGAVVTDGGRVETARSEQKRAEAAGSGPRMLKRPGRYRLNVATGESEPVEKGEDDAD